jgi:hypothetical protein
MVGCAAAYRARLGGRFRSVMSGYQFRRTFACQFGYLSIVYVQTGLSRHLTSHSRARAMRMCSRVIARAAKSTIDALAVMSRHTHMRCRVAQSDDDDVHSRIIG